MHFGQKQRSLVEKTICCAFKADKAEDTVSDRKMGRQAEREITLLYFAGEI